MSYKTKSTFHEEIFKAFEAYEMIMKNSHRRIRIRKIIKAINENR